MRNSPNSLIKKFVWPVRLITGFVFILSGFLKGVDPWGTFYKFEEYIQAFGLNFWHNLVISGVFILCILEFLIGIFLVLGCFRKSVPWVAAFLMCFMLPLTLWIAISNPVSECGCFGDAIVISNWATFWKNVVLSFGIIFLIFYNKDAKCLITPYLQWIVLIVSIIFVLVIEIFGYSYQPLLDFRKFPEGLDLSQESGLSASGPQYLFIYQKENEIREFSENDIPDEDQGWIFKERKLLKEDNFHDNDNPQDVSLEFWDKDGDFYNVSEVLDLKGKEIVLLSPDLKKVSMATTWKINSLNEWAQKNDIKMIAIVAGNEKDIDEWEDLSMPDYPIYLADDSLIKQIVRGNPGVILLDDGKIIWKSTLKAINIDNLTASDNNGLYDFIDNKKSILRNCIFLYIIVLGFFIILSLIPDFITSVRSIGKRKKVSHDDTAPLE